MNIFFSNYKFFLSYDKLLDASKKFYKEELYQSTIIEEYGSNEFFGGKKEAYEEIIEILKSKFIF